MKREFMPTQSKDVSFLGILNLPMKTGVFRGGGKGGFPRFSLKRTMDILASSILLIIALPFMAVIALLVKLDSRGPVFYSQWRVGENRRRASRRSAANRRQAEGFGRPFRIWKFRSMRVDAEVGGQAMWCRKGDPRVTRVGNLLRKSHLDELPQLINVLKGDMSLVGPRPERPEFVNRLVKELPGYQTRLAIKPGLTGLAQIRHRSDLDLRDVRRKIRYDALYVRKASLAADTKILLGTVPMVLGIEADRTRRISLSGLSRLGWAAGVATSVAFLWPL